AAAGVPLLPAFTAVRAWLADIIPQRAMISLPELAAKVIANQYAAIDAAVDACGWTGCDVMVATGLFSSVLAARTVAEKRNMQYVHAGFCPFFFPSPQHRP